ncbi:Hypothetical protein R9X50_00261300 [Acrodontium crateriforme]|uniref:Zn(2)-C6 fungal-type domain-containing protein n=1 Tax=Acrodontium crateriforme TaxID=150365 RepID=A0AAQ3M2S8_9PEZI|nr:Hypothetical protein R9X50_00261300 [Acrodontium crateriforme]
MATMLPPSRMAFDTSGPAASSPSDTEAPRKRPRTDANNGDRSGVPRRKTACHTCRMRKVKCDAVRPVCSLCKSNGSDCEYDNPPGEKLTLELAAQSLHEKLDQLQRGIDTLTGGTGRFSGDLTGSVYSSIEGAHPHHEQHPIPAVAEPARDFLQIPEHRSSADSVLLWEIFENRYPRNALIGSLFKSEIQGVDELLLNETDVFNPRKGLKPPDEERIPQLVDSFLQNVHTKNPILDVESLVKHARLSATDGLGWDAKSCLVLLACALGSLARPFEAVAAVDSEHAPLDSDRVRILQSGESYFVWACRRLGGLKHTILGAQCYFFAGVYLMYTLRPLLSWQYFNQSSVLYQLHMKSFYGLSADDRSISSQSAARSASVSNKQRRLEQSLYWSCFKSESEFRVELPLPQSEIASYENPQMFPLPPSPIGAERDSGQVTPGRNVATQSSAKIANVISVLQQDEGKSREEMELRRHTKELCKEEESWYYYLTEIALRRIGNRILNSFFRQEPSTWLDIKPLLSIAYELDAQVSSWSANLPPKMKQWESNYIIRAPMKESVSDGKHDHVSTELSWAIDNRLLEVRSWLYQPFLYYLIHGGATNGYDMHTPRSCYPYDPSLDINDALRSPNAESNVNFASVLHHLISSGIDCNIKILDVRSLSHRHHGLWFDLRSLVCAGLILLGVVRSGHEAYIPGGVQVLWGDTGFCEANKDGRIGGKIGHALDALKYWSVEASDLTGHWEVLAEVTKSVQEWWLRRAHE